ncbi:hypothetical protein AaE_011513 [Aphanomyces astaci]|uniref:Uncharacterized protein n=1 Tax=Aphanomyces astaci TaxID=112090 RepID=A0A6A4ZIN0_APHAT|nr:hypothetical protein AaE_011513 [Aphanomyces astaci]
MHYGGEMSMHTVAVYAPESVKHLHQKSSANSNTTNPMKIGRRQRTTTNESHASSATSNATNPMKIGRRQRITSNESDSSSATQSSRDCVQGMYDYRPEYHFNLSAMLLTLTVSVGNGNDLQPTSLAPSLSMGPPILSFHGGRKVRHTDQQHKGHEGPGGKRDKKFTDMFRADMALRM